MILDTIPGTIINKWEKLIGKEKMNELVQIIIQRALQIDFSEFGYRKYETFELYDKKTLKDIISSMNLTESEKKGIINIFQDEIKDLPDHVKKETYPYVKRLQNKYFLLSKKYPFESIKKYKSNNKHMLILASGM